MNVFVSAQLATLKMPRPVVLSKKMYLASTKVSFQNLSKLSDPRSSKNVITAKAVEFIS